MEFTELNTSIISQRFKELEAMIYELKETQRITENQLVTMQSLIDAQTQMIQQSWVNNNGTGSTERNT